MNVFEDLVVELKEENLLEETVIDSGPAPKTDQPPEIDHQTSYSPDSVANNGSGPMVSGTVDEATTSDEELAPSETPPAADKPLKKPRNGTEFYRKRAVNDMSNLQMVEHVFTGIEREYLKVVPKTFDDFKAKKALHTFLSVDENENSAGHTEAEFTLMHETEAWCTALAERDRDIPVSSLRQFCDNSRPALSSQALLALARFYRNLPFSEPVRAKFDFVITRLFSKPTGHEKRAPMFSRDEAVSHLNNLYGEWSSIALYSAEDDDSKLLLTALSFEDLAIEAESASSFDQLIESDFFGRLRLFKESISELFYAPAVVSAAVEGNIRVGNAYVTLLEREREKMNAETIRTKYTDLDDHEISDAAGRTLALVEILRGRPEPEVVPEVEESEPMPERRETPASPTPSAPAKVVAVTETEKRPFFGNFIENARSMNKWFLATAVVVIAASVGLYVWSNFFISEEVSTAGVQIVDIENSILKEHVKTARISGETFYGYMLPSWDLLPKEKRQEFLQKMLMAAQEKGCRQVTLTNTEGKSVGYASATRLEVVMP